MSEIDPLEAEKQDLVSVVTALIQESIKSNVDVAQVLALYIKRSFERGVIVGFHSRCKELTAGLIATRKSGSPGAAHIHSDACLLDAQQVMHQAIPGIIELPELVADYGHQCFAAGYVQGVEEQESWEDPSAES